MTFARIVLGLAGLSFAGYGVACLVDPDVAANYIGMQLGNVSTTVEVIAMYGGLQIGVGVAFLACIAPPRVAGGLRLLALLVGSLAVARGIGIALHGTGGSYNAGAVAFELFFVVLAVVALQRVRTAEAPA